MSAVPKRKTSRARRDSRRAQAFKLKVPGVAECSRCKEMKLSHRACSACGYYGGREALKVDDK